MADAKEVPEPGAILGELAEARSLLAQSESARAAEAAKAKDTLREAKARAKDMFLKRSDKFEAQIRELDERAAARDAENDTLKEMLRAADGAAQEAEARARAAVDDAVAQVTKERDEARAVLVQAEGELETQKELVEQARNEQGELGVILNEERRKVQQRVLDLEKRLSGTGSLNDGEGQGEGEPGEGSCAEEIAEGLGGGEADFAGDAGLSECLRTALGRANSRIAELQERVSEQADEASGAVANGLGAEALSVAKGEKGQTSGDVAAELQKSLEVATDTIAALEMEKSVLSDEVTAAKTALSELQSALSATEKDAASAASKAEAYLKAAREAASRSAASSSSANEDRVKVLDAKITELERLLAEERGAVASVREKARSYLKEMSAQRRVEETKLRDEITRTKKLVEDEQRKAQSATEETSRTVAELDGCLSTIAAKQKTVQALQMAVANERAKAGDAEHLIEETKQEFEEYRERARKALADRDAQLQGSSGGLESKVDSVRGELDRAVQQCKRLRSDLQTAKEKASQSDILLARAVRAEAALDLLQADNSTISRENVTRIDLLENELDTLRREVEANKSAAVTAESQLLTANVRLEVAERALNANEVAAEEAKREAGVTIGRLELQVVGLEKDVREANASAASAQRMAGVAARAMAGPSIDSEDSAPPTTGEIRESMSFQSERASVSSMPMRSSGDLFVGDPNSPRLALGSIGSPRPGPTSSGTTRSVPNGFGTPDLSGEVAARDDQIAVLMSQIAELGVLLDDAQQESSCREQQVDLLKTELRDVLGKLDASTKLQSGTPYELLRTTVMHYMRTGDPALLPVLATVLGISEGEMVKVREAHGVGGGASAKDASVFPSLSFFGRSSK